MLFDVLLTGARRNLERISWLIAIESTHAIVDYPAGFLLILFFLQITITPLSA